MRLRERFSPDTFKPNYNAKTISFTSSQWLQQLLSIAIRLNNGTSSHEYSPISAATYTTTTSNNDITNQSSIDESTSATKTVGATGCIILQLYDKNPDFLYNQEDYQDIDYSVLKMQIIIWTQKYLKPDDLFMDWFETVSRHIHHNDYNHNNENTMNYAHNELSVTNVTFCTENLRGLMIESDKQMHDKFSHLSGEVYSTKNGTKTENYGVSEVQIVIVITLCCVLIVCFMMAVILRVRSFCKRQTESRKQSKNDRDSALQVNFAYDINETQVVEKPPMPSTTFGSNVYPRPMKRKPGVCRYDRVPPSHCNLPQKYSKGLYGQSYNPTTVFMIDDQRENIAMHSLKSIHKTTKQITIVDI
ncbi:unnamed protein product [Heterobilharzia americana]|nr:unnamed protein product [Heterobilharzia americana]